MIGSLITTGISLVDGTIRKSKDKKKRKQLLSDLDNQKKKLDKWYNTKFNSDFIESTDAKDAMVALRDDKRELDKTLADNITASGSTAEQAVAISSKANKDYAKAIASLAASGDKYKREIDAMYLDGINKINEDIKKTKNGEKSFNDYYGDTIARSLNLLNNSLKMI